MSTTVIQLIIIFFWKTNLIKGAHAVPFLSMGQEYPPVAVCDNFQTVTRIFQLRSDKSHVKALPSMSLNNLNSNPRYRYHCLNEIVWYLLQAFRQTFINIK